MRAAVLYDVDDIRIEERPVPEIRAGEILVRTQASGICTGDVMAWYVRRKAPLVLGHEPSGIVEAVGKGVEQFRRGDRVFVHHHAPCFSCSACERGDYVQCATWRASKIDPGGLAEFFRVPQTNLGDTLHVPQHVALIDASLVEPLACVMKSLRRSGARKDDKVHVIGLGVMGLMHALAAQDLGARVSGSDLLPERCAFAQSLGVRIVPAGERSSANIVICGPGSPQALRDALASVEAGGTVLMFTPLEPGVALTIDPNDLYFRDIRLIASYSCGPADTKAALELIERGVVTARKLGATIYPLEEVAQAYGALRASKVLKPIVSFDPSLFP